MRENLGPRRQRSSVHGRKGMGMRVVVPMMVVAMVIMVMAVMVGWCVAVEMLLLWF